MMRFGQIMNDGMNSGRFDPEKWHRKHELIVRSIREKGDFNLEEINRKVEEYGDTSK